MLPKKQIFHRTAQVFLLLTATAFLAGCGVDHSPTATDVDSIGPVAKKGGQGPSKTKAISSTSSTSSTAETSSAADLSADEVRSISEWVKPKGKSSIYLQDTNASATNGDNMYALFTVPSGAVSEGVQITMTVYGNYLSDLVVAFQPGGLEFTQDATLEVYLGRDLVDVDLTTLTVWHEYKDGTIEETVLETVRTYGEGSITFKAKVPGFSRYLIRRSR